MSGRLNLNNFYLARVINNMAPYFQLTTPREVSETLALQQVVGARNTVPNNTLRPTPEITELIDLIINTSEGCFPVSADSSGNRGLLEMLNDLVTGRLLNYEPVPDPNARGNNPRTSSTVAATQRLGQLFKIYYAAVDSSESRYPNLSTIAEPKIGPMFGAEVNSERNTQDNTQPWNRCSIFKINTPYVNPANKYTEAISVYMNGIPSVEFSRAVPYLDVKFISGREPTDANNRLNSLSIFKFLEGAVAVSNVVAQQALVAANSPSGSLGHGVDNASGHLSETGMELFTTPQTLVNANVNHEADAASLRPVPVIDPFRPFMTFKSLNIDITSGGGFFAYKTGKLEFVLHDRSRLSEIADFIKPDLYGNTDVMIEYGWNHPDQPNANNLYADLLNASRSREKYMIRNVQFTFDDVGQVNVTLDVAMRGGNDLSSEVIATANSTAQNAMRRFRELAELVGQYREQLHVNTTNGSGQTTREIRGVQILDAAGDYQNNLRLSPQFTDSLRQFRVALQSMANHGGSTATGQAATEVRNALTQLWGDGTSTRAGGVANEISVTLAQQIQAKMQTLLNGESLESDPMLPQGFQVPGSNGHTHTIDSPATIPARAANASGPRPPVATTRLNLTRGQPTNVSLAKLLLHFVALPLAATGHYDDVQLIFYPFNDSAGYAKDLNIGQFIVDANYFFEQYMRFRTESVARAASINLRDFMGFVTSTIIDDPGAIVYGIDSLYHFVRNRDTHMTGLEPRDQANYQVQLETRLRNITPNGEFKHPQVQCYVEALPVRRTIDGQDNTPDNSRTILRLHFVDRQSTMYATQGAILASSRNQTLNALGRPMPIVPGGEEGINTSRQQYYNNVMSIAQGSNLLRNIGSGGRQVWTVDGGPAAIKDFVMRTMPYIIYGVQGSAIKTAALSSQQNAELSTVNMLRSYNSSPLRANGEQPGGLPLSIIPCELSMTTLGCNLIEFTQQFFIDFQTGTTADNIYGVNAVSHKVENGMFETEIRFVPLDAYGSYSAFISRVQDAADHLDAISQQRTQSPTSQNSARNQ